jgi:CRISPR-associated protein Cst1
MVFLAHLQVQSSHAYRRFWHELLRVQQGLTEKERKNREKFVSGIAQRIFRGENILNSCFDHNTPNLQGGWIGHRLYLQEVCGMAKEKLAIIERLGISIAQSEDAKKRVNQLRSAQWNELYSLLLSFVRQGLLGHEEFYALLPPNGYGSASEVRDMVLAVIYEWQHAQERGGVFESLEVGSTLLPDETLVHIQRIGQGLIGKLRNLGRWIARLQTARNPNQIRGAYLNAVQKSAMGFADFVFLAPLDDVQRIWLLRDYLMAFLFDRGREMLIERVEEEVVETI